MSARANFGDALYIFTFGQRESHTTDAISNEWAHEA
jgi:hypothetical protein